MKTPFHHLIAGSLLVALPFQPVVAQSLRDAVSHVMQSNPELMAVQDERLALQQRVEQAKAGYFPTVDINAGYGYERSVNPVTRALVRGGVSPNATTEFDRAESRIIMRQMLFDGFATKHAVDQAQSLADAAAYRVANNAERIGLSTVGAYLNILRYRALRQLAEDNLKTHSEVFEQIKSRAQSGIGRRADVDQAQARVALATTQFQSAERDYRDAETAYQRVVGQLPEELNDGNDVACERIPTSLEQALTNAFSAHPMLRAAASSYDAALSQNLGANAPLMPRVDFEASASWNNNLDGVKGKNEDVMAMLRLRQNLLRGGADIARIDETEHLSEQQKQLAEHAKRDVEQSVRLSWNALAIVSDRLPLLKAHAESAANTYKAYLLQFNNGQRTLLDLLDVQNEYFQSQSQYIQAQYDERYARYRLLASTGSLIKSLELTPPGEAVVSAE